MQFALLWTTTEVESDAEMEVGGALSQGAQGRSPSSPRFAERGPEEILPKLKSQD